MASRQRGPHHRAPAPLQRRPDPGRPQRCRTAGSGPPVTESGDRVLDVSLSCAWCRADEASPAAWAPGRLAVGGCAAAGCVISAQCQRLITGWSDSERHATRRRQRGQPRIGWATRQVKRTACRGPGKGSSSLAGVLGGGGEGQSSCCQGSRQCRSSDATIPAAMSFSSAEVIRPRGPCR